MTLGCVVFRAPEVGFDNVAIMRRSAGHGKHSRSDEVVGQLNAWALAAIVAVSLISVLPTSAQALKGAWHLQRRVQGQQGSHQSREGEEGRLRCRLPRAASRYDNTDCWRSAGLSGRGRRSDVGRWQLQDGEMIRDEPEFASRTRFIPR